MKEAISSKVKAMYDSGISITTVASKLRLPMMEVCVYLTYTKD